jgi:hypothetical protein
MYGIITENSVKNNELTKNKFDINFTKLYFIFLIMSISYIYYYYIYQDNILSIQMEYTSIWPILLILVGLSIFKAKNLLSFIIGLGFVIFALALTLNAIFINASDIINVMASEDVSINASSKLTLAMNFVSSQTNIESSENDVLKLDSLSNYDQLQLSSYTDTNNVKNINIDNKLFPIGFGAYTKNSDIKLPNEIPISLQINTNLSSIKANLYNMKLESGRMKFNNSIVDLVIKDINLSQDVVLDINSNFSIMNVIIHKDIPVTVLYSSNLSQSEFLGLNKTSNTSNVYQTPIQENGADSEELLKESKKLIINLDSNLSQIKITQK